MDTTGIKLSIETTGIELSMNTSAHTASPSTSNCSSQGGNGGWEKRGQMCGQPVPGLVPVCFQSKLVVLLWLSLLPLAGASRRGLPWRVLISAKKKRKKAEWNGSRNGQHLSTPCLSTADTDGNLLWNVFPLPFQRKFIPKWKVHSVGKFSQKISWAIVTAWRLVRSHFSLSFTIETK